MSPLPTNRDQMREIFRQFSSSGEELERQISSANDANYWRTLCPGSSIGTDSGGPSDGDKHVIERFGKDQLDGLVNHYQTQSWLALGEVLTPSRTQRMLRCVEAVRKAGWLAAFSFMYDDFWTVGRSANLQTFLNSLLGDNHVMSPMVWTYFVYPAQGQSGWRPHIDKDFAKNITVWVSLSEATLGNGCIYVVRKNEATTDIATNFLEIRHFSKQEVNALLHAVRALPVKSGEALCWSQDVIHWGSQAEAREGSQPRVSVAYEFSTPDFPLTEEAPFVVPNDGELPSVQERLKSICRSILGYRHQDLAIERFVPFAEKILASPPPR